MGRGAKEQKHNTSYESSKKVIKSVRSWDLYKIINLPFLGKTDILINETFH